MNKLTFIRWSARHKIFDQIYVFLRKNFDKPRSEIAVSSPVFSENLTQTEYYFGHNEMRLEMKVKKMLFRMN